MASAGPVTARVVAATPLLLALLADCRDAGSAPDAPDAGNSEAPAAGAVRAPFERR